MLDTYFSLNIMWYTLLLILGAPNQSRWESIPIKIAIVKLCFVWKININITQNIKGRLQKKNGKENDIVQKGGEVSEKNQILNVFSFVTIKEG